LGSINPEHADDEISVNKKVNCLVQKILNTPTSIHPSTKN